MNRGKEADTRTESDRGRFGALRTLQDMAWESDTWPPRIGNPTGVGPGGTERDAVRASGASEFLVSWAGSRHRRVRLRIHAISGQAGSRRPDPLSCQPSLRWLQPNSSAPVDHNYRDGGFDGKNNRLPGNGGGSTFG